MTFKWGSVTDKKGVKADRKVTVNEWLEDLQKKPAGLDLVSQFERDYSEAQVGGLKNRFVDMTVVYPVVL